VVNLRRLDTADEEVVGKWSGGIGGVCIRARSVGLLGLGAARSHVRLGGCCICAGRERKCYEALQELENETAVRPGLHGQAIRLEGCGAVDEVQLVGDSCRCGQVRGVTGKWPSRTRKTESSAIGSGYGTTQ
jgi:hypothetical protein